MTFLNVGNSSSTSTTMATCSSVDMTPVKLINKYSNNILHTIVFFYKVCMAVFVEESDVMMSREYWTAVKPLEFNFGLKCVSHHESTALSIKELVFVSCRTVL